jgi:hypothetical protein
MESAQSAAGPLRARVYTQEEWEDRRPIIEQLYWLEDRELLEVVELMKLQYGFCATYDLPAKE